MTTLDKLNGNRQSIMGRFKCFLVSMFVPNYLRRAILMCSLAAFITKAERSEFEKIAAQVRNELHLDYAFGHAAMVSPMQWGSRIWAGLPPINVQQKSSDLIATAKTVYDNIPRAMIYSSDRVMIEDIYRTMRAFIPAKATA